MANASTNPLQEKSYLFAIDIVKTCRSMIDTQKEFVLSKQLLRSGTSIGANIEESQFAQSKADFISKLSIALKEASESRYWIRLLAETNTIPLDVKEALLRALHDIINILIRSIKTAKGITR